LIGWVNFQQKEEGAELREWPA